MGKVSILYYIIINLNYFLYTSIWIAKTVIRLQTKHSTTKRIFSLQVSSDIGSLTTSFYLLGCVSLYMNLLPLAPRLTHLF